jgi:ParB family chromosome partitioning protein
VTKARILQALRQARGEQAALLIDHLKKGEMAEKAQELLAGSGWLPEPFRRPGRAIEATSAAAEIESDSPIASGGEESTATGCGTAVVDFKISIEDKAAATDPHTIAAE